jgi:O-antigen ligase
MKKGINLENFIYLTIFLLPSYLVKISIFGLPTNVLEIFILIAFIGLILKRNFRKSIKPGFRIGLGLIFLGLILSVLINKNYAVGLGITKGWFVFPIILAYTAFQVIPQEKRKNIFLALYLSALTIATTSLWYYFSGQVTFDGRLQGIFNSPNYLAMYLAPGIIIGAYSFKSNFFSLVKLRMGHALSFIIILTSFYLTYSYAAWVAVIASILISEAVKNKKNISFKKTALVLSIIILILVSQWNNQKFKDIRTLSERSSLESRIIIWSAAGKILGDNIIFGIGPGTFQDKYLEYQKYLPPYLEWAVPHPHNLYLAFWLYGGILSLIGFIALIIFWLKEILIKEKNSLWAISFAIMLYFLLHGLIDTTYFKNDLASVFWLNFFVLL